MAKHHAYSIEFSLDAFSSRFSFGSLGVYDQLDFGGLLDRQIGRVGAFENFPRVDPCQAIRIGNESNQFSRTSAITLGIARTPAVVEPHVAS